MTPWFNPEIPHCVVCNPNPVRSFHRKLTHELTMRRLKSGFLACELSTAEKEICPQCFAEWNVPELIAVHKAAEAEKARQARERQRRELATTPCQRCGRLFHDRLSMLHDHCGCRAWPEERAVIADVLVGSIYESV